MTFPKGSLAVYILLFLSPQKQTPIIGHIMHGLEHDAIRQCVSRACQELSSRKVKEK